jgi:RNA polymerase sigma-70 factor (ECF subfamily)
MSAEAVARWSEEDTSSGSDISDVELVRRTKAGEVEAFSELVRRHEQNVYNLSFRFMREASLAEDMAQEAFLKAFRLLKGFRGACSFSTWMYRVTCSVCLTELGRRKRRGEVELLPNHGGEIAPAETDVADLPELMRGCVGQLPEHYARIITLYYFKETPYEEIARVLSIPMGTLKTWMHRARLQLRKIVEKELCSDGSQETA